MRLQNRAAYWDGEILVLEWRVVDSVGWPMTEWCSRASAVMALAAIEE